MKKISVAVPCYNEEENIGLMYEALTNELSSLKKYDYEIIFADNDSKDRTAQIMCEIAAKDKKVKVILNQTNFGAERSAVNCLKNASGDAYISIPCDFQEPPEMIPRFVQEWEDGHDIVWGQKTKSKENPIKYVCRKIFYGIIDMFSDRPQLKQVTGFGLIDRKVIDILLVTLVQDPEYSARYLACEYGFDIKLLPYTQRKRERGKSNYNMSSYFQFAITSLCNTSTKPLHLMTILGFIMSFLCMLVAVFYFVYKVIHWDSFDVGMAPMVIGLFFVSGIQLFCMGILGEYISVIVRRLTQRPLVIEKEKINFDNVGKKTENCSKEKTEDKTKENTKDITKQEII